MNVRIILSTEENVFSVGSVINDLLGQQREVLHGSQKYMNMSPAGVGTKNDCAGENQQQFTRTYPTRR